jgi:Metallo-peptidase family M12B Reprolysin-like
MRTKEADSVALIAKASHAITSTPILTLAFLLIAIFEPTTILLSGLSPAAAPQVFNKTSPPYEKVFEDDVWQQADRAALMSVQAERRTVPDSYRALRLDRDALARVLDKAPMEPSRSQAVITLPLPEGELARFRVVESPILEPELAAEFPEIKTYSAQGIDDPTASARFDFTPAGFHAIVLSASGTALIEPYSKRDAGVYISYYKSDLKKDAGYFACLVRGAEAVEAPGMQSERLNQVSSSIANGTTLRTYRLAVAATAEYTRTDGGGTVGGTLAAITTNINMVNAIFEREVAIRLILIGNEAAIIFTNPATDGYTNNDSMKSVGENQNKLDSVIGPGNYDIGFLFDSSPVGSRRFNIQGAAGGVGIVCVNGRKGQAVAVFYSGGPSNIENVHVVAHEIGHQFGATHTFNGVAGGCGSNNRFAATAYEPGSGSTVMSYGYLIPPDNDFLCDSEGLLKTEIYFHAASLEQMVNYITIGTGGSCAREVATGNNPPTVDAGERYNIPRDTPFTLTASGSDADGDTVTYCWEQFDIGAAAPPDTDDGSRPIMRSFAPVTSRSRTFPQLSDILSGSSTFGESLPTTTRAMNFRVTARDNRSGGGGVGISETRVNVKSGSGPFVVTQPDGKETWTGGSLKSVSWDVANTSSPPINCKAVTILLSTDGGKTFPVALAQNTPNDGFEPVTVPNLPTIAARIKVEAVGNIFFNISKADFVIASGIDCAFSVNPASQDFGSSAEPGSVSVTTAEACSWTVSNIPGWIIITAGKDGSGSGAVNYLVATNTGASRTATMTVAGHVVNITQAAAELRITGATVSGKKLFIEGQGFDAGAVVLLNGQKQKTANDEVDPDTKLLAKKTGKKIKPGDKLQVMNSDGNLSPEYIFEGP